MPKCITNGQMQMHLLSDSSSNNNVPFLTSPDHKYFNFIGFSLLNKFPLFCSLIFHAFGYPWSENMQWKFSEINNLYVLNCEPFSGFDEFTLCPAMFYPGRKSSLCPAYPYWSSIPVSHLVISHPHPCQSLSNQLLSSHHSYQIDCPLSQCLCSSDPSFI